jgi:hypothetical protein
MMETRQIATYVARLRVGFGFGMMLSPRLGLWIALGPKADAPVVGPLGRIAGIRDVVLGAGGSIALGARSHGADWLSMGSICDIVDGVVLMATPGLARRARAVGLGALALGAYQMYLARAIAAEEQATVASA